MTKWVTIYEVAKVRRQSRRATFRSLHAHVVPYHSHLRTLPKDIHLDWLYEEMDRLENNEGMHTIQEEWEYACGYLSKVCAL